MRYWWLKLLRYAWPQWRGLLAICGLMLLSVALGLLTPWPMKLIIDNALGGQALPDWLTWLRRLPGGGAEAGLLGWLAGTTVLLYLLHQSIAVLQGYIEDGVGSRMTFDLAAEAFEALQRHSLLFHRQQRTGDLIRRLTADTTCIRALVIDVYIPMLTSLITMLSMFLVMWQLSPRLAGVALVLSIPLGLVIRLFAGPMSQRKYEEWELQGQMSSLAEQTLSAIPVVQAFGREEVEDERFRHAARQNVQANLRSEISQHQFHIATGTVTAIGAAIVMVLSAQSVLAGEMTVGSLLVLVSYFSALYAPIQTLAYLSEGFSSASAGARRVLEIFSPPAHFKIENRREARRLVRRSATGIAVRLENVSFGYQPGSAALHDISLELKAGETVALVGASGAGKSTLVSLIARLFDPWQGAVYFDDIDVRQLEVSDVRHNVAIVPQDPFLLPLSIAENIAYGRPGASRTEIIAAAVAAKASEFIERLPQGYDTVIGERGVTLSGGEKQRLSIARALLKDAPILVLDEPTAALDARTESDLSKALQTAMQDRTTIIIAHRLSTIRHADRIIVLEHGRIVETGQHDQLQSAGGVYEQLLLGQGNPIAAV